MSRSPENGGTAHSVTEIEVTLRIEEGKLTAESQSGPKSGSIQLAQDGTTARLVLEGSGSDRATAALSGPELANFRTIVDATLSALHSDEGESDLGRSAIYSGYRPLRRFDDGIGVTFEAETLRTLDLLTEDGDIPGGSRQVQCTVLGSGTAMINLAGGGGSDAGFDAF